MRTNVLLQEGTPQGKINFQTHGNRTSPGNGNPGRKPKHNSTPTGNSRGNRTGTFSSGAACDEAALRPRRHARPGLVGGAGSEIQPDRRTDRVSETPALHTNKNIARHGCEHFSVRSRRDRTDLCARVYGVEPI